MNHSQSSDARPTPAPLADLFAQYLQKQTRAQSLGLALPDGAGLVEPHDANPVRPVDPQLAWEDARAVLRHFPGADPAAVGDVPPDWSGVVIAQEPAVALAFCLGNFPQLVRHLQPLLGDGAIRRPSPGTALPAAGLVAWSRGQKAVPTALLAAGALRLARQFDEAEEILNAATGTLEVPWGAVHANEQAALAWHRGDGEQALRLWEVQPESAPVLFNRGLAHLFLGQPAAARAPLARAAESLPESSAWHHLARLYLELA